MLRDELLSRIQSNSSVLVVFITATWCAPCQTIKPYILEKIKYMEPEYTYLCLDVDADADCYAALKSKKQFKGVPTLLAYAKGSTLTATLSISGTNTNEIDCFFESLDFL